MSKSTNKEGWEESEFPILCEPCLGSNPYVRMTKQHYGDECKICQRPHTIFRWCPAPGEPYRSTEVCQICARFRNVCQSCVLDLQFGLPTQVRDSALALEGMGPQTDVNRQYFAQSAMDKVHKEDGDVAGRKVLKAGSELLHRLRGGEAGGDARFCTMYAQGKCTRGDACPYRHALPTEGDYRSLRHLYRSADMQDGREGGRKGTVGAAPSPPSDQSITTLFLPEVPEGTTDTGVRATLYPYGEIKSLRVVTTKAGKSCAFITYVGRASAESAMEAAFAAGGLEVDGVTGIKITWSKPRPQGPQSDTQRRSVRGVGASAPSGRPGRPAQSTVEAAASAPPPAPTPRKPPPPPGSVRDKGKRPYYSQDPTMMGANPSATPQDVEYTEEDVPGA